MSAPTYDVDYFIAKFEGINEEKWCRMHLDAGNGVHCALGHCGASIAVHTPEEDGLQQLLRDGVGFGAAGINDGDYDQFQQPTPKQRILAALRSLKGAPQ